MIVNTLQINGRGSMALAPASGTDMVNLAYLQSQLGLYAPLNQALDAADISDFNTAVLAILTGNGVPLSGTGSVPLLVNGGLKYVGSSLAVDSGVVSLVGHKHVAANITDFSAAVLAVLTGNGVPLSGTGLITLAPNGGLVQLPQGLAINSGTVSQVGHHHVVAAIDDFTSGVLSVLLANGVPLSGTGMVTLQPGGGLIQEPGGLAVNSGVVSFVGHQHRSVDITDLATTFATFLGGNLQSTSTIGVSGTGPYSFRVLTAPGGALVASGSGLAVNLGTAHTQAAYGDHTHAQLHNPITLGSANSTSGTLTGQQVSFEVTVVPGGGLLVTPSGLQADWSVVQRAGTSGGSTPLLTANTPTLQLGIAGNVLSGTIPLDTNPPSGIGGMLVAGTNGLRVALGTTGQTAAAGNHTHNVATSGTDGFMSASNYTLLQTLAAATPPMTVNPETTFTLALGMDGVGNLSGTVLYNTNPITGRGALGSDGNGLYAVLGSGTNMAAQGNHLHDTRYPQLSVSNTLLAPLILSGTGSTVSFPLQAATKQYVDGAIARAVSVLSGVATFTPSGPLQVSGTLYTDFQALVAQVNIIIQGLNRLGWPT